MVRRRKKNRRPAVEQFGLTYLGPSGRVVLAVPGQDEPIVFERGIEVEVNKYVLWRCAEDLRVKALAERHRSRWHARPILQEPEGDIIDPEGALSVIDLAPELGK